MNHSLIEIDRFKRLLLEDTRLIDVRAPIEFSRSTMPGALNLPLLDDQEREQVGITYKNQGKEEATALGHRLVSGQTKAERIAQWCQAVTEGGCTALFCARGGMRSEISQRWISEQGVNIPRLRGGHKALRAFLLENIALQTQKIPLLVLSGQTGVGKTKFLRENSSKIKMCDLEHLANHRGSAFGYLELSQPAQATFENQLSVELLKAGETILEPEGYLVVEDESRFIGQIRLPDQLYNQMKIAPMILLEAPLEARIDLIMKEYLTDPLEHCHPERQEQAFERIREFFPAAVRRISRKLGGERTAIVLEDMKVAFANQQRSNDPTLHREWISKLLNWYYDPYYQLNINKAEDRIVVRGEQKEILEYLQSFNSPALN